MNVQFTQPVTPTEFIVPFVSSSILIVTVVLMTYLFIKFPKRYDYLVLACLGLASFIFTMFLGLTIIFGGLYMNAELGMLLYRTAQTGVTLVMMSVVPYCAIMFKVNPNIQRNLNIISVVNIVCGIVFIAISYTAPDLFISITEQSHYAFLYRLQSMWGRGEPGKLYSVRNIMNAYSLFIMLYCVLYDMIVNKMFRKRLALFCGVLIFIFGSIEDLYSYQRGTYIFLADTIYSRFATSVVIFTVIVVMSTFKYFLDSSLVAKKTQLELQNRQRRNNAFMDGVKTFTDKITSISKNIEETSANLQSVSEKTVDNLVITKMHSGASHQASSEFSKIATIQKSHIDEVITFTSSLFNSLSDVRRNINNQKNNISDTIEYTSKLAFTMDSMNDATEKITVMSTNIKEYTMDKKNNIIDAFKKFEDVNNITDQILNSIEFIKDIAHKTNLLSINSGIQASKAGHYGRGFSVLSREIRDLSSSTHLGTQEIESLLINIANTLRGVSDIRDYVLGSFDSIIEHVNETTGVIDEIIKQMNYQSEKNEFLKLNIQMLDSSSEVIDSSIRHQNEFALYVQKNMGTILRDFEDISAMSSHQTKDLDSIDKDITNVSKIGKELYSHSAAILGYYNTMKVQNNKMIEIVAKFHQSVKTDQDREIDEIFERNKPKVDIDDERLLDSQKSIEDLFSIDEDFVMDDDYVSFDDKEEKVLNGQRAIDDIYIPEDFEIDIDDKGEEIDIDSIMSGLEDEIKTSEKSIEELFVADDTYIDDIMDEEDLLLDIDKIITEIEDELEDSEKSIEELFVSEQDGLDFDASILSEDDEQFARSYLDDNIDVDKILQEIDRESFIFEKSIDDLFVLDEDFVGPGVAFSVDDFDIERLQSEIEEDVIDMSRKPIDELFTLDNDDLNSSLASTAEADAEFAESYLDKNIDIDRILQEIEAEKEVAEKIEEKAIKVEPTSPVSVIDSLVDDIESAFNENNPLDAQFADDYLNKGVDVDKFLQEIADEQAGYHADIDADVVASHTSDKTEELSDNEIISHLNETSEADAQFADDYLNKGVDIDKILQEIEGEQSNANAETQADGGFVPDTTANVATDDNAETMNYLDSIAADYAAENEANKADDSTDGGFDGTADYLDSIAKSEFDDEDDSEPTTSVNAYGHDDTISYLDAIAADYAVENESSSENADDSNAQSGNDEDAMDYLDSITADYATETANSADNSIDDILEESEEEKHFHDEALSYLDSIVTSEFNTPKDENQSDEEYDGVEDVEMNDEQAQELADLFENILSDNPDKI